MKLIMVTGLSGAGKSLALKVLEDAGYEAIDNIPLAFIPVLVDTVVDHRRRIAVGTDVRSRDFSETAFLKVVEMLTSRPGLEVTTLFLDCLDEVLRRRFTETRRRHPLAVDRPVMDGIRIERKMLGSLRDKADTVIDTSDYSGNELKNVLRKLYGDDNQALSVFISSFAYRKGVPREADLVFDVRFLKNPFYVPELKELNGLDEQVGAHIETDEDFARFFNGLTGLLLPLLPRYLAEGKSYLTVAIGCTGGKHRSVYVSEKLAGFLSQNGYKVETRHRDLEKKKQ